MAASSVIVTGLAAATAIAKAPQAISDAAKAIEQIQAGIASLILVMPTLQLVSQVIANQQASGSPVPSAGDQATLIEREQGAFNAADAAITAKEAGTDVSPPPAAPEGPVTG